MEIIRKYKNSHYIYYLSKIEKEIGNNNSIETWVKGMGMSEILIWIQATEYVKTDNYRYFEQACKVITLLIRFFMIELDLEENVMSLTNTQIGSLIYRFEYILKTEYAYRNNIKDKRTEYTLLKDVK